MSRCGVAVCFYYKYAYDDVGYLYLSPTCHLLLFHWLIDAVVYVETSINNGWGGRQSTGKTLLTATARMTATAVLIYLPNVLCVNFNAYILSIKYYISIPRSAYILLFSRNVWKSLCMLSARGVCNVTTTSQIQPLIDFLNSSRTHV